MPFLARAFTLLKNSHSGQRGSPCSTFNTNCKDKNYGPWMHQKLILTKSLPLSKLSPDKGVRTLNYR